MDYRRITKIVAQVVVSTAIGAAIAKTTAANVPATQKFKLAEMVGGIGSMILSEKLQPYLDNMIDDFFDRREADTYTK